ncbi:MAG: hypothetical protein LLG04_12470 [Parachlamydia sp.]|nr:hypothetical protein [Parachlamydia sp.]
MILTENTDRLIFCPPPPGKPNPKQPYDPNKPRERVPQAAQKGATCWYYAMNFLRPRCGKSSPNHPMRAAEVKISAIRKMHTKLDEKFDLQSQVVRTLARMCNVSNFNKEQVQQLIDSIRAPKCLELLQEFCAQKDVEDLFKFVQISYLKGRVGIIEPLVVALSGKNLQQWYTETKPYPKPWKDLDVREGLWFCDWMLRITLNIQLGFVGSTWHPGQSLNELFQELKKHGPLMFYGRHGQGFYLNPSFELTTAIAGRTIFGWKPNTPKDNEREYHSVVVVGVNLDTKVVYFVDPRDSSGPQPKDQKVYVTSYDKFKASLVDISGREGYDDQGNRVHPATDSFAYYHPTYNYA